MEILLAKDMGFCWGVRRAIDIMEKAAQEKGDIVSLGPIVHNPQVVAELETKGVHLGDGPQSVNSKPVAITAHGAGPEAISAAKGKGAEVIDTTCPIVTRSQRWAKKMAENGFTVIVYGDTKHREVKGVLGWAGGKGFAVTEESMQRLPAELSRVAVISQTTQSPEKFAAFVSRLLQERVGQINELRVINTLCDVTSSQQAATRELAQEVGLMLVVGGRNSANTRHLAEVSREEGAETHHIESVDELRPEWFEDQERVGISAGASTPDSAVEAVVDRIRELVAAKAAS
ncbi:MAG: 4-hydroxy-3-methylbut-2-enyl diphosphate reductase [Chloroflexi bacterium]|nr:4-hydroxy-3-methylbut-2-enyl diphosphate reductase [Chloroflexota bacterium]